MMKFAVIAMLAACPVLAQEDRPDVATVFSWCQKDLPECATFIVGLQMGIALAEEQVGRQSYFRFCIPNNLAKERLTEVVFKGLLEAGEVEHFPAKRVVLSTLRKAFPCSD